MNNTKFPCYYYLHTNGSVIYKPFIVVCDGYFDSPFVKKVWCIKSNEDFNNMVNELYSLTTQDKIAILYENIKY